MIKVVQGDLIKMAEEGHFNAIAHGCNTQCVMGSGIAPKMARAFGCDEFNMEKEIDESKLGNIDSKYVSINGKNFWVFNLYTQLKPGQNDPFFPHPANPHAVALCLNKMCSFFVHSYAKIGIPLIGCGLGGMKIKDFMEEVKRVSKKCEITVVVFDKGLLEETLECL